MITVIMVMPLIVECDDMVRNVGRQLCLDGSGAARKTEENCGTRQGQGKVREYC